jgi:hypothetical protein
MHPTNMRPLDDSGSPAFACGNALVFPTFENGPFDSDAGAFEFGDGSNLGWASAWIDLGGEG